MSEVQTNKPGKRPRNGAGFTIPAAAVELGVSYKTLLRAIDKGEVRAITFGGTRRITAAEVDRLRAELSGEPAPAKPAPMPSDPMTLMGG